MHRPLVLHPEPDAAGPGDPSDEAPEVLIRNAGEALVAAAGELAERGVTWRPPEAVDSLGVLGYRLWFTAGPPDCPLPGPHPVDVRPDGQVRFFTR